jgi:Fe-S cluster assembly protein SufD
MALKAYAESFEHFAAALPAAERTRRRGHLERFLAAGFPSTRQEQWRYTDLSGLAERGYAAGAAGTAAPEADYIPGAQRLVYINGQLDRGRSTAADLHGAAARADGEDGVSALNAAFSQGGLQLRLARGEILAAPLQVLSVSSPGASPAMAHQRHLLELGENAEATVVFQFLGGEAWHLDTQIVEMRLAPGARLRLYRIQDQHADATLITRIDAQLDRDSSLHAVAVDCGAGLVRNDFNVQLAGPGAEVELSGFYQPGSGGHVDNHTRIVHAAPRCRSRELFKGIVGARGRAVFNGMILVKQDAQKTDSEQRVANLLLSPRAEVDAKPELEIYADDVKCAHGATVGQLDETALQYLRSRGIDEAQGRALLMRAFAGEVLQRIGIEALREACAARLGYGSEAEIEP